MASCWEVDGTEDSVTVGGADIDGSETCKAMDASCCEIWASIAADCCW